MQQLLQHRGWHGSNWNDREDFGVEAPTCAVARGSNRVDVFGINAGTLFHTWWDGSTWGGRESLGGGPIVQCFAVAWGPNRLDLFGDAVPQRP